MDLEELEVVNDLYSLQHQKKLAKTPVKEPLHFIDKDEEDAIASLTMRLRRDLASNVTKSIQR